MINKVSALSLLSNAVLVWNSVRIAEIVGGLERSVDRPVRPEIDPESAHERVMPSRAQVTQRFEGAVKVTTLSI